MMHTVVNCSGYIPTSNVNVRCESTFGLMKTKTTQGIVALTGNFSFQQYGAWVCQNNCKLRLPKNFARSIHLKCFRDYVNKFCAELLTDPDLKFQMPFDYWRGLTQSAQSSLISSAPFSATMYTDARILTSGRIGRTLQSMTLSESTP